MTLIRWTEDERQTICEAAAILLAGDPTLELLAALRQVIPACIPTHRQRHIAQEKNVCLDVRHRVLAAFGREMQKRALAIAAEIPPDVIEKEIEKPIDPAVFLRSLPLPNILAEVGARLQAGLDGIARLEAAAHARNSNGNGHHSAPVTLVTPRRKPRIAIVGLLQDQFRHVEGKCADRGVELVYVNKDSNEKTIHSSVDAVIVERHAGSKWSDGVKKTYGSNAVFPQGGASSVVRSVFDLASRLHA